VKAAVGCTAILTAFLAAGAGTAAERPLPRLERADGRFRLVVDGQPFLILGAQAHNSSASDPAALGRFWDAVAALEANTAEVPVYWEQIEPQPGRYDFHAVDAIVAEARRRNLRLVLLWFATWKNGEMHYAPAWLKRDAETYRRVRGPAGEERDILSPFCAACRDADARAFAALMRHVREIDESQRTVIFVQVENECGLLGTDRDYSQGATTAFRSNVPPLLLNALASGRAGTWSEVFAEQDAEAFSAWHVARYVDAVAAAGKQEYPLPMYVNTWMITPGDERAGRWPSGGPTSHVLDVWKAAAPHVDLLAPDFYQPKVEELAAAYARPDNALYVPEIRLHPYYAAFAFSVLARFDGLGLAPFGVDDDGGDAAAAALRQFGRTFRLLRPLLPLIAQHQGTRHLRSIVQDVDPKQVVRLGPRVALVASFSKGHDLEAPLGCGLVLEKAPDDLIIAGLNLELAVRDLDAPLGGRPRDLVLSIDEGTFDGERWIPRRRLNGDERRIRFGADGGILRVTLQLP
jgi:hypothetical protein